MRRPVGLSRVLLLAGLCTLPPATPAPAQEGSSVGPVPPEFLARRRARLLESLAGRLAVIGGERLLDIERDYPQDSDFRQDANFFYLTGLEEPEGWLVLNAGAPGAEILYLPARSPAEEIWTGRRLGPGPEASRLAGVQDVRAADRLPADLRRWVGEGTEVVVSVGDERNRALVEQLLSGPRARFTDAAPLLARLRLVKDQDELRRLRRAIDVTIEALLEVWRVTEPGLYEYEIEAVLEYVFRAQGAERVGFPSIVASGPNTTVLHYDKNRRRTEAGDLLVTDVGAEFGYYTADITRTIPVSGTFTPRQRAIYELVLGAQEDGLAEVRPGRTIRDAHAAATRYLDAHSGDLCGGRSCSTRFMHGLSHWLGLDVHDVGDILTPFEPGMVLTVEPGVYLVDEDLGVRIEDVALVTAAGHELLTAALPRAPEEIESVMREEPRSVRLR